jgi:hypothetical protein
MTAFFLVINYIGMVLKFRQFFRLLSAKLNQCEHFQPLYIIVFQKLTKKQTFCCNYA